MGKGANPITEQKTAGGLDLKPLRRAYERWTAELASSLYANDAEVRIINHATALSSPFEPHGRDQGGPARRFWPGDGLPRREEVIVGDRVALAEPSSPPSLRMGRSAALAYTRHRGRLAGPAAGSLGRLRHPIARESSRPPARQKQDHFREELRP